MLAMRRTIGLALIAASLHCPPANADGEGGPINAEFFLYHNSYPRPEGAKLSIVADSKKFLLGEPIRLIFRVANEGKHPFGFSHAENPPCTYFRCPIRVHFKHGPEIEPMGRGTMREGRSVEFFTVAPGKHEDLEFNLGHHVWIREPGTHAFRITHDLGWRKTNEKEAPGAEITLEFVRPTPEQARKIFDDAVDETLLRNIHDSVYVPILAKLGREGDFVATRTLAFIPTPEATSALIELARTADSVEGARLALKTLAERIPDPNRTREESNQRPWEIETDWYWKRTWRPDLSPELRRLVAARLFDRDPETNWLAVGILAMTAEKGDLGLYLATLDSMVARSDAGDQEARRYSANMVRLLPRILAAEASAWGKSPSIRIPSWLNAMRRSANEARAQWRPETLGWLERTNPVPTRIANLLLRDDSERDAKRIVALLESGRVVSREPRGPGEILAYLSALRHAGFRPEGLEPRLLRWAKHDSPILREAALQSFPNGLHDKHWKVSLSALDDSDVAVRIAALEMSVRRPEFKEPAFRLIAAADDFDLFRQAAMVAARFDCSFDLMRAAVSRFEDQPNWTVRILYNVVSEQLIEQTGGGSGALFANMNVGEARAIQHRWLQFLHDNEKTLRTGKKLLLDDPILAPDLFPDIQFYDHDRKLIVPGRKAQ